MSEPAWLVAKVDQLLAKVSTLTDRGVAFVGYELVMLPLAEPREGASMADMKLWERTCDNCRTYCPPGKDFYCGHVAREAFGTQVLIIFGCCERCAGQEGEINVDRVPE